MSSPGFFDTFRRYGGPTLYPSNKTPVTADVLEAGLILAIVMLAVSFFLVLPGVRHKERIFVFIRVCLGLFILAAIVLCNFGQEWEVSEIETKTQYKAGTREEIEAKIGVKIGLRSVNITLLGKPVSQLNETINYNERFHWSDPWGQGRAGFGPFAGRVNREYREAQFKGLPYPILWVAEYFTIDGEGIRWGRFYRHAGFYTHIMLWTAFPLWILALILFMMVIRYGAYFMMMTGGCLLIANAIYGGLRNPNPLVIPFEDNKLSFHWGWCFWLNMVAGLLCVILGAIIWALDECGYEALLCDFFGVDLLTSYEDTYPDATEQAKSEDSPRRIKVDQPPGGDGGANGGANGGSPNPAFEQEDYDEVVPAPTPSPRHINRKNTIDVKPMYRRRTKGIIPNRLKSKKGRRPMPPPPARHDQNENYDEDYENWAALQGKTEGKVRFDNANHGDVHVSIPMT